VNEPHEKTVGGDADRRKARLWGYGRQILSAPRLCDEYEEARAHWADDRYRDAIRAARAAVSWARGKGSVRPNGNVLAQCLRLLGDIDCSAAEKLGDARHDPDIGDWHEIIKEGESAYREALHSLDIQGRAMCILRGLGRILTVQGRWDEAYQSYRKAFTPSDMREAETSWPRAEVEAMLEEMGRLCRIRGDAEAQDWFERKKVIPVERKLLDDSRRYGPIWHLTFDARQHFPKTPRDEQSGDRKAVTGAGRVPAGLRRCPVCGEYNGYVGRKELDWTGCGLEEEFRYSIELLGVWCRCQGIPCPATRPGSSRRYCETPGESWHWPVQSQNVCGECRGNRKRGR